MSYVRSAGYSLKDQDDNAALQVVIGDLQRIALAVYKGTPNAAYTLTPAAASAIGTPAAAAAFTLGTPLRSTILTSGTSHSLLAATRFFSALLVGGGGAGGGESYTAPFQFMCQGGGSGATICLLFQAVAATVSYTIGAGGAGVLGGTGNNGTSSTVTYNGYTATANGGLGGVANTGTTGQATGGIADLSTPGILAWPIFAKSGESGTFGSVTLITGGATVGPIAAGYGGSSPLKIGGVAYGTGGAAIQATGASASGVSGSQGVIVITEF